MKFEVETGVPIPKTGRVSELRQNMGAMRVGDSVLLDMELYRAATNIIVYNYRGQFTVRKVDSEHFRLWRIKEAND